MTESQLSAENQAINTELSHVWIARMVDGDESALGLLYDSLVQYVYGLALGITKQVPLAEEVVQDTFWQVWRQAPRYNPDKASVKGWVLNIARSRALDTLRQIEKQENELDEETMAKILAPDSDNPANLLASIELDHELHGALANLAPLPRQLVSLAFFRGLTHDEIASCCGLPLGTVKSHIRLALQTLKQDMSTNLIEA